MDGHPDGFGRRTESRLQADSPQLPPSKRAPAAEAAGPSARAIRQVASSQSFLPPPPLLMLCLRPPCVSSVRWEVSLKVRSAGAVPRKPMLVICACETCMRQESSSSTPSAQRTAALMGDTWVKTATCVSDASGAMESQAVLTRSLSSVSDSPPGGVNAGSERHCCHVAAGTCEIGMPVPVAVVEFCPAVVDGEIEAEQLACGFEPSGGLAGGARR